MVLGEHALAFRRRSYRGAQGFRQSDELTRGVGQDAPPPAQMSGLLASRNSAAARRTWSQSTVADGGGPPGEM